MRVAADRADCDSRVAQTDRIGELTAENESLRAKLDSETNKLRAEADAVRRDWSAYAKKQAAEKDQKINELDLKLYAARGAGSSDGPCSLCPELKKKIAKLEGTRNAQRRLSGVRRREWQTTC